MVTNQLAMKSGYKKTEIGIIPDDWEVRNLGDISDIKTGPFGTALHQRDYVRSGTPIITVEHLSENGVIHQNLPLVSDQDKKRLKKYQLKENDIVFSRVGSVDRNSLITKRETNWLFSGRLLRIRLETSNVNPIFLSYFLHYEPTKRRIRIVAVGQTMPSLNTQILKNFHVAFPKKNKEQFFICQILSNTDKLIEQTKKIIEKKKNIKKGTIQALLTGKIRLNEFDKKWKSILLGEIFTIFTGKTKSKYIIEFSKYLIMDMGSISSEGKNIAHKYTNYDGDLLQFGDLVMPKDSLVASHYEEGNIIGKTAFIDKNNRYVLGDHVYVLRSKNSSVDPLFLSYLINSYSVNIQIRKKATGSAQIGINKKTVEEQTVIIPTEIKEQSAIAKIFSDMDSEIKELESKRDKYIMIKNGMMQKLLTGEIRLT
jgi:type I restriction enzyme, S subunit